jgi:hypothetical protein
MKTWMILPLLATAACTTDVKGESCGFLDAFVDSEGNTYCPDDNAPADCEELKDAVVGSFVECGLDEETARSTADDAFACDSAVATTTDFDACIELLEKGCTVTMPDECSGALLTK